MGKVLGGFGGSHGIGETKEDKKSLTTFRGGEGDYYDKCLFKKMRITGFHIFHFIFK